MAVSLKIVSQVVASGQPGPAGKSAYQIAVDNGFEGTESEWLKELHPFKGWFDSVSELEEEHSAPSVGEYAYVKGATSSDPVKIYECSTEGSWSDSGRTVDTSTVQTFRSGEAVNDVDITDDSSDIEKNSDKIPTAGAVADALDNVEFATGEKVKNVGIDDKPTAESDNLVKSSGVQNELALGAVYDVSAKNPTAGPNNDGKFESLSALLSDANLNTLIPTSVRKGGMSIKFVQSSDNKYVQYRLMTTEWSSMPGNWEQVVEAIKLDGVTAKETKDNSADIDGYIPGYNGYLYAVTNSSYRKINVEGIRCVRVLGILQESGNTGQAGFAFYDESATPTTTANTGFIKGIKFEVGTLATKTLKEYIIDVPEGAKYIYVMSKLINANIPTFNDDFYCYLQTGYPAASTFKTGEFIGDFGISDEPNINNDDELIKSKGVAKSINDSIKTLYDTVEQANLNLSNYEYGADTPQGVWYDITNRISFFNNNVIPGTVVKIKMTSRYKFVITLYNKSVSSHTDVSSTSVIKQYENDLVTEDDILIPAGVKSIVIKVARTDNGNITNDNINSMFDYAFIESIAHGHIGNIYKELGSLNDGDVAIFEHIRENTEIELNLSNHVIGADGNGHWVDTNTRVTFFLGEVKVGDLIHIKSNDGYKFVIEEFKTIIQSKNDISPSNYYNTVPLTWTTEHEYIVASPVKSIIFKVAKTNDTADISGDDTTQMISVATKVEHVWIDDTVKELSNEINNLDTQINSQEEYNDIDLSNNEIGTESNGTWIDNNTRVMFFIGEVLYKDLLHIRASSGYRFVLIQYNTLVDSKEDMSPAAYIGQVPSSWVTEYSGRISEQVKSIAIKVSRTDNADITEDDPTTILSLATIYREGGIAERLDKVENQSNKASVLINGEHSIVYSGDKIKLQNNYISYLYFGETDWYYTDNGVNQPAEGLAVYGNYMFKLYTIGLCKCYDISNDYPILISSFKLGSYNLNHNHANCCQFGQNIVEGDFPYLYIANSIMNEGVSPALPPICYVEKITPSGSTLIQTITINTSYSFRWCNVICGDDGYLYAVGINSSAVANGIMRVVKYPLPSLASSTITLTDSDIIDLFDVVYDGTTHIMQGMEIRNGKIFLPMSGTVGAGAQSNNNIIRVIDIASKATQTDIPIPFETHECEDVSVYKNVMYIGYYSTESTYQIYFQ